jgi:hypothetical protein
LKIISIQNLKDIHYLNVLFKHMGPKNATEIEKYFGLKAKL